MGEGLNRRLGALEWTAMLGMALVLLFFTRTFLFGVVRVEGDSMLGTLVSGDRVLVTVPGVKVFGPARGDVVTLRYPGSRLLYVKRVIALAGDVVELSAGRVYVNGALIDEPYVTRPDRSRYGPARVPDGCVFVLGDNRADSKDSRDVGCLALDMLAGRVRAVLWPRGGGGI